MREIKREKRERKEKKKDKIKMKKKEKKKKRDNKKIRKRKSQKGNFVSQGLSNKKRLGRKMKIMIYFRVNLLTL